MFCSFYNLILDTHDVLFVNTLQCFCCKPIQTLQHFVKIKLMKGKALRKDVIEIAFHGQTGNKSEAKEMY